MGQDCQLWQDQCIKDNPIRFHMTYVRTYRSHIPFTLAMTDSLDQVAMVDFLRLSTAHLKLWLPGSTTITFLGCLISTLCLYRPYQSFKKGPGSLRCCGCWCCCCVPPCPGSCLQVGTTCASRDIPMGHLFLYSWYHT